jgi:hypothetical protein
MNGLVSCWTNGEKGLWPQLGSYFWLQGQAQDPDSAIRKNPLIAGLNVRMPDQVDPRSKIGFL